MTWEQFFGCVSFVVMTSLLIATIVWGIVTGGYSKKVWNPQEHSAMPCESIEHIGCIYND